MTLYQYCACDPANKIDPTGAEWCWNPFASGCGIDWELVGKVASTAEVVTACGLVPVTDLLTAAICLDGVDDWTASTMNHSSAKQVIISAGFHAALGMPQEEADQAAVFESAVLSGVLGAGAGVAAASSRQVSRAVPSVASAAGTAAAPARTARTMSRELITGANVKELDNSVFAALRDSTDSLHAEATAFVAANKDKALIVGRPAVREASAKLGNSLIKRELTRLGLRADLSHDIADMEPLADRFMRAFQGTNRTLKRADALTLASARISKRALVISDIKFYKRALDLGVTNIQFIGSPEKTALAASYVPKRVTVPTK